MRDAVAQVSIRDAILDATDRLLARYGYKKMTIDDLAAEVGIGKGSVYLHFTSKQEIALSHIDRIIERLQIRLNAIAARKTPVEERLRLMLVERVLFRFDSVQHYTQSLDDLLAGLRPRLLERRKKYFGEEAQIFAAVIDEGISAGNFGRADSLETAHTLLQATNGLLPYSLSTQELGARSQLETKVKRIAQLIVNGLAKA
jgi:AcrR family transcriptional regulator